MTLAYGSEGELTTKTDPLLGITRYGYDVLGNLVSVTLPSGKLIEYLVDGGNRRVEKKVDGTVVTRWLYRDSIRPVAELDGSGNLVSEFVYASGSMVPDYVVRGTSTLRIISDQLGSPRLVVDAATGNVSQRMRHDPWGNVIEDTAPGFIPFGFAGGMYDADTGLVRFGARDYYPVVGRWISKDPIRFGGSFANLYVYVGNDPVNFLDPSGLMKLPADPSQLPPEWTVDPSHLDPNGDRYRHPSGDSLDSHRGRPGERGWKGSDHYHRNGDDEHLKPGSEVPDPPTVCVDNSPTYSTPDDQSNYYDDMIDDFFDGGLPLLPLPYFSPWMVPELGPALSPASAM